jgi:hypothetical protein
MLQRLEQHRECTMTSEQRARLRVCLREVSSQRHGSSLDRVKALETLTLLLGEILLTDRKPSEPPKP